jgi:hypothetical protein
MATSTPTTRRTVLTIMGAALATPAKAWSDTPTEILTPQSRELRYLAAAIPAFHAKYAVQYGGEGINEDIDGYDGPDAKRRTEVMEGLQERFDEVAEAVVAEVDAKDLPSLQDLGNLAIIAAATYDACWDGTFSTMESQDHHGACEALLRAVMRLNGLNNVVRQVWHRDTPPELFARVVAADTERHARWEALYG